MTNHIKTAKKLLTFFGLGEPATKLWHYLQNRRKYMDLPVARLTPDDCPGSSGNCPSMGRRRKSERIYRVYSSCAYRCAACGLIYFDPQPDPNALKLFYSEEAHTGYAAKLRTWTGTLFEEREVSERQAKLDELEQFWRRSRAFESRDSGSRSPLRFLEIGVGNSHLLVVARDYKGWDVTGIDISLPLAREGRERYGLAIHEIDLSVGSATIPPGSIDIIYSTHALEHVRFPANVLLQAAKFLSPNGILVVEVPNGQSIHALYGFSRWPWGNYPEHLYFFSGKAFELMCANLGLDCESLDSKSYESDIPELRALMTARLGSDREFEVERYLPGLRASLLLSELQLVARKPHLRRWSGSGHPIDDQA